MYRNLSDESRKRETSDGVLRSPDFYADRVPRAFANLTPSSRKLPPSIRSGCLEHDSGDYRTAAGRRFEHFPRTIPSGRIFRAEFSGGSRGCPRPREHLGDRRDSRPRVTRKPLAERGNTDAEDRSGMENGMDRDRRQHTYPSRFAGTSTLSLWLI